MTQSGTAIAFCTIGMLILAIAHHQLQRRRIGEVPLISPRAKHTIGLLLVIIGVLIFAAQLLLKR